MLRVCTWKPRRRDDGAGRCTFLAGGPRAGVSTTGPHCRASTVGCAPNTCGAFPISQTSCRVPLKESIGSHFRDQLPTLGARICGSVHTQANEADGVPKFIVLDTTRNGTLVFSVPTNYVCDDMQRDELRGLIFLIELRRESRHTQRQQHPHCRSTDNNRPR
jgi:hypothetical protein